MGTHHDVCTVCQEGGPLLCCDSCPASFHLRCLDPPLFQVPDGDWNCKKCTFINGEAGDQVPSAASHFRKLFEKLAGTNPRDFCPAAEVRDIVGNAVYESRRPGKKQQRKFALECSVCKRELYTNLDNFVSCSRCVKCFHLYCVEPMLFKKPPRTWYCEDHDRNTHGVKPPTGVDVCVPENSFILPEDSFSMDFFPYGLLPKKGPRKAPRLPAAALVDAQQKDLFVEAYHQKSRPQSSMEDAQQITHEIMKRKGTTTVEEFLRHLEAGQRQRVAELVEKTLAQAAATSNDTEATFARILPLLDQFSAWQRLMSVNNEVNTLRSRGTPQDSNIWEELDRYAVAELTDCSDEEDDMDVDTPEEPERRPSPLRNTTKAARKPVSRTSSLRSSSSSVNNNGSAEPTKKRAPKKSALKKITVSISAEDMDQVNEELPASKSMLIGRCDPDDDDSPLTLNLAKYLHSPPVRKVSHQHAEIEWMNNNYHLMCLGRNGMHVDGQWIRRGQRILLQNNQVLRIGPFSLIFYLQE